MREKAEGWSSKQPAGGQSGTATRRLHYSSPLCLKGWKTIINVVKDAERGEKGGNCVTWDTVVSSPCVNALLIEVKLAVVIWH